MEFSVARTAVIAVCAAALGAGAAYVVLSRQQSVLERPRSPRKSAASPAVTPTRRTPNRLSTGPEDSYERTLDMLRRHWASHAGGFNAWWAGASESAKLALLKSARELLRQRLAEQGSAAALDALCPEFSERLLPRLAAEADAVPALIEARVSAPDAAREHDAGFVRASWGAVPAALVSMSPPMRGAHLAQGSPTPHPSSPAAYAAKLSAMVTAGEWDVAEVLTDNRAILVATFWADLLLLSRAVASGVEGRIASALPPADETPAAAAGSPAVSPAAAAAQPRRTSSSLAPALAAAAAEHDAAQEARADAALAELAHAVASVVAECGDAEELEAAPRPASRATSSVAESDGEATPEPEEAEPDAEE